MAIIAISRGTFSGGEALAKVVAERLGYRCVSREIILEAAWGYGVPAEEMLTAMEKQPPLWSRMVGKRTTHLLLMRAALCQHASGGNLVYHGHLGHLLLPGIDHVLRVRVIADMEYRLQAAMRQQHLTRPEATAYIDKMDKERRQWTRSLFDVDWDDPALFDLVLSLNRMRLATACEAVVHMAGQPEFTPTAASSKAMWDLALGSRVAAVLATDARTRGVALRVVADDGLVTVAGTTQSTALLEAVPVVVRQVDGVRGIRAEVRLLREGADTPA
jgi:cytidylate kinase